MAAIYSTPFTAADGTTLAALDANWGIAASTVNIAITSNEAKSPGTAAYNLYQVALNDNCYMEGVIGTVAAFSYSGFVFRMAIGGTQTSGIRVNFKQNNATALYDGGTGTVWSDTSAWAAGTVARVELEGTTLRIYKNGVLHHTYSGITTANGASKYSGIWFGTTLGAWNSLEIGNLEASNQTGSPISDISNTGWTPSAGQTLYTNVDEVAPADADYIYTTASGSVCEVRLTSLSQPGTGDKTLSYRLYSSTSDNMQVDLVQNTTVLQTWTHTPAPATVTQYNQAITASVTDWTNLRLRFTATAAA